MPSSNPNDFHKIISQSLNSDVNLKAKFELMPQYSNAEDISKPELDEIYRHEKQSTKTVIDVWHLYKNPKFLYKWKDGTTVEGQSTYINDWDLFGKDDEGEIEIHDWATSGQLFLKLKSIHSMSAVERVEYDKLLYKNYDSGGKVWRLSDTPESIFWLFQNHFDAFDLIERGLALAMD